MCNDKVEATGKTPSASHTIDIDKVRMRRKGYVSRKGPLTISGIEEAMIFRAFKNILWDMVARVDILDFLNLESG